MKPSLRLNTDKEIRRYHKEKRCLEECSKCAILTNQHETTGILITNQCYLNNNKYYYLKCFQNAISKCSPISKLILSYLNVLSLSSLPPSLLVFSLHIFSKKKIIWILTTLISSTTHMANIPIILPPWNLQARGAYGE